MKTSGKIYLVGAGPGDPELLTVKAHRLLRRADVILHDDLVPAAILSLAGPHAEVVNVGKRCGAKTTTQDAINARMIEGAHNGREVVRLKSGDPGIFGRLAEETDALDAAVVPYEIVPGITAGLGAAAALGVSLTDRRKAARVVIVTGHKAYTAEKQERVDWKNLAREDATLVVYMPGHEFSVLRQELIDSGLSLDVPAVIVSRATTPQQRQLFTTIGNLDKTAGLESPSILLIGRALEDAAGKLRSESTARVIEYAELLLTSE